MSYCEYYVKIYLQKLIFYGDLSHISILLGTFMNIYCIPEVAVRCD